MVQMIEQVALQWEEDEDRFRKLQISDLSAFNDRIDALTVFIHNTGLQRRITYFKKAKYLI